MKEIFAKRLKNARLLSAMSMDKLVDAMGGIVSKNAIAKYERGEMMPNSSVLIELAKALSVKPDYFFRPFAVEIGNVEFRKKSKLGAKKVTAIKQQVTDQIERYLEIEDLLHINAPFVNPIQDIEINEPQDVEQAVNVLLKKWHLGFNALPNVIELLEDKDVKVIELDADLAFDGLSGWAFQGEKRVPLIVVNRNYTIERKNEKISDLLQQAGGVTQYAFVEGATLVRKNPFYKEETLKETFEGLAEKEEVTGSEDDTLKNRRDFRVGINLQDIIDDEDSKHNLVLKTGDQLIIPSTKQTVKVEGEVLVPSLVRYEKGMTLKDYISKSGGFSTDAKKGKTYVVYANGDIASTKHFLFFRSYPKLEPGAAILVPAKPENRNKLTTQEVIGISTGLTTLGLLIDRLLQ